MPKLCAISSSYAELAPLKPQATIMTAQLATDGLSMQQLYQMRLKCSRYWVNFCPLQSRAEHGRYSSRDYILVFIFMLKLRAKRMSPSISKICQELYSCFTIQAQCFSRGVFISSYLAATKREVKPSNWQYSLAIKLFEQYWSIMDTAKQRVCCWRPRRECKAISHPTSTPLISTLICECQIIQLSFMKLSRSRSLGLLDNYSSQGAISGMAVSIFLKAKLIGCFPFDLTCFRVISERLVMSVPNDRLRV